MNKISDIFKVFNYNTNETYNEYINDEKNSKYKYEVYNNSKLNLKYSNKYNVKKDTIILVSEGKYSGKIIYLKDNALVYGTSFYILKLLDNIDIEINMKYVYYFLKYIDFKKFMNEKKRNKILLSTIKNLNIPNISINKQNEIIELFDKLYSKYDIDYLNSQYNNYEIFNYLAQNNLLLFEEVYKVEDTINKQKENNDIIIQSYIRNIYFNMFKDLQKNIIVKKLKSLYLLQNKIKPDNKFHIIIYYDDIIDDVVIKKINYNMEVKQKVIILSKKNIKFNDNINEDYILYYLKTIKDEIFKHIDNLPNLKSILSDFDIPIIPLINQNDLILNINNNLFSINTNIKSYIIDEILTKRLLQLNKDAFTNINCNDDNNIFLTEYEQTPALSPK